MKTAFFQSFEDSSDREETPFRLSMVQAELRKNSLSGYLVPRSDVHQGEYVAACDERLSWLTGFTGSAGICIVGKDRAGIFVDGRYSIQAKKQTKSPFEVIQWDKKSVFQWIKKNIVKGKIGFDPWLHTADAIRQFENLMNQKGGKLVPLNLNPVDEIWTDQPSIPLSPIVPHDIIYSGKSSIDKKKMVCETLKQNDEDAVVLSSPESIAWLLNIRGSDVPRTPLPLSFVILSVDF